ncbi:hypothetical protein FIU28_18930 [Tardiphaga sp. vice154]|uniref:alginate O-acetyltransferase AlgX-related protein n=1 Tax=Tardiphaga sp. vice154 TaxID=2592814 RepID=UPI0011659968|nr:hypothetical protein [Tardiphaga sp. vice154]QDM22995.1 hypothetical protein FIU28_18930 [Tardiphaga sp. vice154]
MRTRAFILSFAVLLFLPLFQMLTGVIPVTQVSENRSLAPAPSMVTPLARIPHVANEWFNDHFGLRPLLIRLKTQIDYSVFKTSDRVMIGSDGWLFYRSTVNIEPVAVEKMLAGPNEERIVRGMREFSDALNASGIHTILTVNMMSDRFYADKLPTAALRRPAHPRIDDLVDKLRKLPNVEYIDSFAILKAAKATMQIFHKTDFHWNDPAAFLVAKASVDAISAREGLLRSAWSHPLEIDLVPLSGGIASFMPLFLPPSEKALMVKPNYKWGPDLKQGSNIGIFESTTTTAPGAQGFLPPAVFIGDSFLDGMVRAGLQSPFVSTARLRWKNDSKLSTIAANLPAGTRWCLIEFIEVNMAAMGAFSDLDDVAKAVEILKTRQGLR